jgi:molecular chaperone HscB
MNHFEFFGIPMSFVVDEAAVKRQYLLNSRKYHPDFHSLADDHTQTQALEMSTRNNEAFKVLSDPDARMQYILREKELLSGDSPQNTLPQDFLMEMMEINEAVMELEFDFSQEQFEAAMTRIREMEEVLETTIKPLLDTWTEQNDQPGQLEQVRDFFYKKRYLLRTKENLSKFAPA